VPVLHTLQTDGLLGAQYRLNGVVTLVDAVNGMGSLDAMPEAAKQAAVADRLVITKTDIADAGVVERLRQRLEAMNPFALVATAVDGELDPAFLADIAPRSARAKAPELNRWLYAGGPDAKDEKDAREGAPPSSLCLGRGPRRGSGAHDASIHSFCLWFEKPFTWEGLNAALQALTSLRGPDLLRVKGIVHVAGERGPVVLQGAQHVFHPPITLEGGADTDPRSRIVFIVRGIPRESIEALFAAVGGLGG
jgi:G3E family GTPase